MAKNNIQITIESQSAAERLAEFYNFLVNILGCTPAEDGVTFYIDEENDFKFVVESNSKELNLYRGSTKINTISSVTITSSLYIEYNQTEDKSTIIFNIGGSPHTYLNRILAIDENDKKTLIQWTAATGLSYWSPTATITSTENYTGRLTGSDFFILTKEPSPETGVLFKSLYRITNAPKEQLFNLGGLLQINTDLYKFSTFSPNKTTGAGAFAIKVASITDTE